MGTARRRSNDPIITRQEDAAAVDLNRILARFKVTGQMPPLRQPNYSEVDYDMDLQGAFAAIAQAKAIYRDLPEAVKAKYGDWREVLAAAESGQLKEDMVDPTTKEEAPPPPTPPVTPS